MQALDLAAALLVLGAGVFGLATGVIRPLRVLVPVAVAAVAAGLLAPLLLNALAATGGPPPSYTVASPIFIVVLTVVAVVMAKVRRRIWANASDDTRDRMRNLRWLDRLAGGTVGAALAFGVMTFTVYILDLTGWPHPQAHLRDTVLLRVTRATAPAWAGRIVTKGDLERMQDEFDRAVALPAGESTPTTSLTPAVSSGVGTKTVAPSAKDSGAPPPPVLGGKMPNAK